MWIYTIVCEESRNKDAVIRIECAFPNKSLAQRYIRSLHHDMERQGWNVETKWHDDNICDMHVWDVVDAYDDVVYHFEIIQNRYYENAEDFE